MDFADIRAYPPADYPGLVVFRPTSQARDVILAIGAMLINMLAESSPRGQLWIVEDSRLRIRE